MTQTSDLIEAAAARWLIQVEATGTLGKWAELDSWLAANPRHRAAFLRLSTAWQRVEKLRTMRAFDGTVDADLLSPKALRARKAAVRAPRWRHAWVLGVGAATAAVALVAIQLFMPLLAERFGTHVYTTQIGGRQHIQLTDSSRVTLNTDSELRVYFNDEKRRITLVRGEAAFRVVPQPNRPFEVQAGRSTVHVLGTAFSVRLRDESRVDVRVTEGRVSVGPSPMAVLSPGNRASVAHGRVAVTREPVDTMLRRLLWTQGRLFFDGETLAEAVEEFNRYNRRPLVIEDPRIAGLRISGTFTATDPEGFIRSIQALPASRGADMAALTLESKGP